VSETNAQTKTSDQGLLAAGFFVGLTPLYYAKINNTISASYFPAQNSIIPSRPSFTLGVNAEAVTCKNGIAKYVETIEARKSEH
jgi:hypothetical protein